jgi:hypothetical protein
MNDDDDDDDDGDDNDIGCKAATTSIIDVTASSRMANMK